jgi:hypothetical protein
MIEGSCHCGRVTWRLEGEPESATACNCTACRRYGALWAYGHEGEDIWVHGETHPYSRASQPSLGFHFCPRCGCVAYWRALTPYEGRRRIAVNLRLAEPEAVSAIPIQRFDGLGGWRDLPRDGRCVVDMWY